MAQKCEFGIVGLGRIGGGLALQALEKGRSVAGYDVLPAGEELLQAGLHSAKSLEELAGCLSRPRKVFLYVHAGPVTEESVEALAHILEPGDVLVDGGNSYWGDSVRRHGRLAELGIQFVDLGTSGGLSGARHGACFMAGGDREAVELVEPILSGLCVSGGYVHAGPPGAGHFVKLVHNGIEFGMMQAIGEGLDLLESYPAPLDVAGTLSCWRNGSVIRSWLVDLLHEAYVRDGLEGVPGYVEDTGEVNWLVADAVRMEVPIPVIAQSVMQLFASRDETRTWAKAIAMMRRGFGGHPYGPLSSIAAERKAGWTSRSRFDEPEA
ncbi:MAG TPA: NADP-dependent phosphogluconate dehydrogenase [Fimbriimonadaceae bacterium]|nr:NADP-dependent phosphogluconate dehydrogenase [Fimbriimonadaceae bacterium]